MTEIIRERREARFERAEKVLVCGLRQLSPKKSQRDASWKTMSLRLLVMGFDSIAKRVAFSN